jgi:tetratricopeptide (TPR) repeat protein
MTGLYLQRLNPFMSSVSIADNFYAAQHLDRGIFYQRQNRFNEAIAEYDIVLKISPDDKYARWNRATSLLSLGEYEEGFKEHEVAWTLFDWQGFGPVRGDMARIKHLPIWDGEPASDKRVLVYHELGFGDGIQTLRYISRLKEKFAKVTLVINQELVRLANQYGVEVVDHVPADVTSYDYRLPMFGVMRALRQTRDNIPGDAYVKASRQTGKIGKRIGLVWSGRTQIEFSLDFFLSKLDFLDGYQLYSLQHGPTHSDVRPLAAQDFADTAELIPHMDHIITIDSAPAHLAGAMGHPSTHLLLPFQMDWRWYFTEVWYPTIKTYKQTSVGDWDSPFAKLKEALSGH